LQSEQLWGVETDDAPVYALLPDMLNVSGLAPLPTSAITVCS
jgi:hypothetical protein